MMRKLIQCVKDFGYGEGDKGKWEDMGIEELGCYAWVISFTPSIILWHFFIPFYYPFKTDKIDHYYFNSKLYYSRCFWLVKSNRASSFGTRKF